VGIGSQGVTPAAVALVLGEVDCSVSDDDLSEPHPALVAINNSRIFKPDLQICMLKKPV
jgi:hypothetical protein